MLAIRLKRVGRANLAQYRVIVQDSRRHPKRGAVVEYLGTYDPHAKDLKVEKDRVKHFLSNGAQPSTAVARLLKADGVKLPKWVTIEKSPKRKIRNPEKLRKNQSNEEKVEKKPAKAAKDDAPAGETKAEETERENETEEKTEDKAEETPEDSKQESEEQEKDSEEKPSKPEKDAK